MGEDEVANDVQAGKQEHTDLQRTKKKRKNKFMNHKGGKEKSQAHYLVEYYKCNLDMFGQKPSTFSSFV